MGGARCSTTRPPLPWVTSSISFGDLGPAAQTQIQAAITQPVQRPVPMPTDSAAGSPVEMTTERVARLLWTELGISRCSQITKHWNRWAVEEALESPPASEAGLEPAARPGASQADRDVLRQGLGDRLSDRMGRTGMAGMAREALPGRSRV